jgi:membrane-associated phospholipid phosphatase
MVLSASRPHPGSPDAPDGGHPATGELVIGALLLAVAAVMGIALVHRSWLHRVDHAGFRLFAAQPESRWARALTHAGSVPVLGAGVVALCVIAALKRDWIRAASLLVAPIAAVVVVERVAKPLVGRNLEGVHSYPSGTVTVVAALVTGALLLAPRVAKVPVALVGGALVVTVCIAVVVLRWHYPSDTVGGVCVGTGAVLFVDGLAAVLLPRVLGASREHRVRAPRAEARPFERS